MALFKQGEVVVDMDTGQQFKVDGGDLDLDEKRFGRVAGGPLKESPEQVKTAATNARALPQAPMAPLPPQVRQEGQRSATQEPAFQKLAGVTIPAAAAAASFIPGLGGPIAGALLGAGGTAANQALGFEEFSPGQIALSGAIPPAVHGTVGAVKRVAQGMGSAVAPQVTREAGIEAASQKMGAPTKSIDRAAHLDKPSKAAFDIASQQGDVPLQGVNNTIIATWDKLTNMANAPTRATKYLENLSNKYAGKATTTYQDLTDELQLMRTTAKKAFAQKDSVTGSALMDARAKLLDEMDKISPELKKANKLYRREQAVEDITGALRGANPNNKVRKIFEEDALISGAFSRKETQEIYDISDKLASIGVQGSPYSGVTAKLFNMVSAPIAGLMASQTGRALLRQTFKDGVTPQGLHIAAQFGRAYLAQGGEQD